MFLPMPKHSSNNKPKKDAQQAVHFKDANAYDSGYFPTWCPGCGNFSMWTAFKNTAAEMKLDPEQTLIVYGVGCSGNGSNFLKSYAFHGLHGRALPVATGARLANKQLKIIVMGGDGDMYGIGISHLINAMRRNLDMTVIVHNNQIYALTTGQTSPTTAKGTQTKSTPFGAIEQPINPITLALSSESSFVARTFAGDIPYTRNIYRQAIEHKGFSFVDVFQPCVTFNKINTYSWFRERTYSLEEEGHDPSDKFAAYKRASDPERLAIGLFYKEERAVYTDELAHTGDKPLFEHDISDVSVKKLMEGFV
jgi:2-oxoglutarate/2-oxoacid ferredoxin oxidoreductase subunit beta